MGQQTPADKLRAMVDNERLRGNALEILEEWECVREWADALDEIATSRDNAVDAIEDWQETEDRDEKADARDAAFGALESLLGDIMCLDELPDLPNICETPTVFAIRSRGRGAPET